MKKNKCIVFMLLSMLVMSVFLSVTVLAAGSIQVNHDVSLTISYKTDTTPLAGAGFDIYQVAEVDEYGQLTTTKDFAKFNVNIQGKNDDAWRALASTLEGYVLQNQMTPSDSGKTDQKGQLSFPTAGKKLTPGLYLVLGHRHTQNDRYYDAAPFMVMLPELNQKANVWSYDVKVNAKYDSEKIPQGSGTVTRKVLKVWHDNGQKKQRPEKVVIELLRDGKVYQTVTLNAANNWRHTWTNLDNRYKWTVVEKELKNYTVEVTCEGITFVVTNTYNGEKPAEKTSSKPVNQKLPQTGQLWWPVPVLLVGGAIIALIGKIRRRGSSDEEK